MEPRGGQCTKSGKRSNFSIAINRGLEMDGNEESVWQAVYAGAGALSLLAAVAMALTFWARRAPRPRAVFVTALVLLLTPLAVPLLVWTHDGLRRLAAVRFARQAAVGEIAVQWHQPVDPDTAARLAALQNACQGAEPKISLVDDDLSLYLLRVEDAAGNRWSLSVWKPLSIWSAVDWRGHALAGVLRRE